MRVPEKAPGKRYALVWRTPDFTLGATSRRQIPPDAYPRPDFGDTCVCCNAPQKQSVPYNLSNSDPLELPACAACASHISRGDSVIVVIGALFMIAAAALIYGLFETLDTGAEEGLALVALLGGAVGMLAVVSTILKRRKQRIETHASGHHPEIEINVNVGQTAILTANRQLALTLVERNEDGLHP